MLPSQSKRGLLYTAKKEDDVDSVTPVGDGSLSRDSTLSLFQALLVADMPQTFNVADYGFRDFWGKKVVPTISEPAKNTQRLILRPGCTLNLSGCGKDCPAMNCTRNFS